MLCKQQNDWLFTLRDCYLCFIEKVLVKKEFDIYI